MLQEKYDSACAIIDAHNKAIGFHLDQLEEKPTGFISPGEFIQKIQLSGGTSEDRLKKMSHEDILDCLPTFDGIKPKAIAKDIAQVFRGKEDQQEVVHTSAKKADKMSIPELIVRLNPEDSTDAVSEKLKKLSKGEAFIVYNDDDLTIDAETTEKLLKELIKGWDARTSIEVNGKIKPIYKIGHAIQYYVDENPIYAGRPLRPDGTCDQLGRSWEGVPKEVRQFIRIGIDIGSLKVSHESAHNFLDWALKSNAMEFLAKRYPNVSLAFNGLEKSDKLPSLKVLLGSNDNTKKKDVFSDSVIVKFNKKTRDNWVPETWTPGDYRYFYQQWTSDNRD